jgi:hypothetical protein
MPKKISASRAALPGRRRNELDEMFDSISPEAAAFVARARNVLDLLATL